MTKLVGFIFGPNGSGKGTLADKLTEKGYIHIGGGNLIRQWAQKHNRTDIIDKISQGNFIDNDLLSSILEEKLPEVSSSHKLLFEGIPRKKSQIKIVKKLLQTYGYKPAWIIVLHAPLEVLIERVSNRVFAPDGKIYHMTLNPPPAHFKMSQLKMRLDDRSEIAKKRYEYYITHTLECVSDEFFLDTPIKTIDATQSIDEVYSESIEFISQIVG